MCGSQIFKVESLEDIALKTCYHNVISTLRMGTWSCGRPSLVSVSYFLHWQIKSLLILLERNSVKDWKRLHSWMTRSGRDLWNSWLCTSPLLVFKESCSSCQIPDVFLSLDTVLIGWVIHIFESDISREISSQR